MAEPTQSAEPKADQTFVLSHLSQAGAAYVLNCKLGHVRNNAHRFPRNADGTYDAQRIVQSLLDDAAKFEPAELDDRDLEALKQTIERGGYDLGPRAFALRLYEKLQSTHGAAGLAAIGAVVIEVVKEDFAEFGDNGGNYGATDEERAADRECRNVFRCVHCKKFRWGRSWKKGATPEGYRVIDTNCPKCDAAGKPWPR